LRGIFATAGGLADIRFTSNGRTSLASKKKGTGTMTGPFPHVLALSLW